MTCLLILCVYPNIQHIAAPVTFVSHGGDVVEPLFNSGDTVRGVFVASAGYLGDGGHWAFQRATGFGHHGVVAEMEIQCLDDVGGIIVGT